MRTVLMQGGARRRRVGWLLALGLLLGGPALAGPIEDAKAKAEEGDALMKKAEKARKNQKTGLLVDALKQYATAHKIIVSSKLQNDAPELLTQIVTAIQTANALPEVETLRRDLLKQAIDAAAADKLAEAYDRLADLRDLDPRIKTVDYALNVIGDNVGGN